MTSPPPTATSPPISLTATATTIVPTQLPEDEPLALQSIADLSGGSPSPTGLFMPLSGYERCLQLTQPCRPPARDLLLVPIRSGDLAWENADVRVVLGHGLSFSVEGTSGGVLKLSGEDIKWAAWGSHPPDAADFVFLVPLISPADGDTIVLLAALQPVEDQPNVAVLSTTIGTLSFPEQALLPVAAGLGDATVAAPAERQPALTGATLASASEFTEAAPFLPAITLQADGQAIAVVPFGVSLTNEDGEAVLVPFFGSAGSDSLPRPTLPYLVRTTDGTIGIYVAKPESLDLMVGGMLGTIQQPDASSGGGTSWEIIGPGLGALALGLSGATIVLLVRRRTTATATVIVGGLPVTVASGVPVDDCGDILAEWEQLKVAAEQAQVAARRAASEAGRRQTEADASAAASERAKSEAEHAAGTVEAAEAALAKARGAGRRGGAT